MRPPPSSSPAPARPAGCGVRRRRRRRPGRRTSRPRLSSVSRCSSHRRRDRPGRRLPLERHLLRGRLDRLLAQGGSIPSWRSYYATVIVRKPPAPHDIPAGVRAVFLAGSIDQGAADDWQARLTAALVDLDVVILNPRRDAWDASWRQSINEPRFREQVEWELDGLQ